LLEYNSIVLIVLLVLFVMFFMPILQFLMLLFYKFKKIEFTPTKRDELAPSILENIKDYEDKLFELGFEYKYVLEATSGIENSDITNHIFYYYHSKNHVHAFITTLPFKGSVQVAVVSMTSVYSDNRYTVTFNNMAGVIPAIDKSVVDIYNYYHLSIEELLHTHLKDRKNYDKDIKQEEFDIEKLLKYENDMQSFILDASAKEGYITYTKSGYRYRANLKVLNFANDIVKTYKKITSKNQAIQTNHQTSAILTQMQNVHKKRGSGSSKTFFVGTLVMFAVLFYLLRMDIVSILILVVVLIIHELGHYVAMKFFGYRDVGIMFTPIGAVTVGYKEDKTSWQEFVVALAGPLPGILLSIGLIVYLSLYPSNTTFGSMLFYYAILSLIINYINLLPVYPLDGARILYALLLHRYPRGQFYFYIISMIVISVEILVYRDYILGILLFILVVGFVQHKAIASTLSEILKSKQDVSKEYVASFVNEKYKNYTLDKKVNIASQVWSVLSMKKPSWFLIIGGGLLYLMLILPPLFAFGAGVYRYIIN